MLSVNSCQFILYHHSFNFLKTSAICYLFTVVAPISWSGVYIHPLRATITNEHRFGSIKQQIFILLQFWKPKVQNEDVSRATEGPGENPACPITPSHSSWCDGCGSITSKLQYLPLPSRGILFYSMFLSVSSFLLRTLVIGPPYIKDNFILRPLMIYICNNVPFWGSKWT